MKKILKRIGAYFIDMMVVMLITQCLSGVPFINKQLDTYNKYYQEYSNALKEYSEFKLELQNSFKDEKITKKEYNKIIKISDDYKQEIEKFYDDKKITKKEYKTINKNMDNHYLKIYKKLYSKVEKNSICYFIIYLITTIFYFVFFNYYTNGETLGKKIFHLKLVNNKDNNKKVSILSYIIRAIFLYQPIYYIIKLICVMTLNGNDYYSVTSIAYDIQYYLQFIIILTVMIKMDGRGLHDLLAGTRVASYNRKGEEIDYYSESFLTKKLDEKVIEKKEKLKQEKTK